LHETSWSETNKKEKERKKEDSSVMLRQSVGSWKGFVEHAHFEPAES